MGDDACDVMLNYIFWLYHFGSSKFGSTLGSIRSHLVPQGPKMMPRGLKNDPTCSKKYHEIKKQMTNAIHNGPKVFQNTVPITALMEHFHLQRISNNQAWWRSSERMRHWILRLGKQQMQAILHGGGSKHAYDPH